jgi:hypothetical protein
MSEPSPVSKLDPVATDPNRPRDNRRLAPGLVITAVLFLAILGLAI